MKKFCTIILILFSMFSPLFAQKNIRIDYNQINKQVEELKDSLSIPGITVGIAIDNEIKYVNTFGYKNLEPKTKLTINSVWPLCSISKQFAAVACLKLVEENKLSLQDKISKYFGHLPKIYQNITVYNLLSQTSGIKDYLNEKHLYGLPWEKVKNQVFGDTLNFQPGDAWRYSNTGFWIAAKIVEKITGMDYYQYLTKNFFTKLEMENTERISGKSIINSRVNGYEYRDNRFYRPDINIYKLCGQGDGDITSTLYDLMRWEMALFQGKLIDKKLVFELWKPVKLNSGKVLEAIPHSGIHYGMGWFIKIINGDKIVWTPGSGFGFSTSSQYMPKYNLTIIVFCNKEQFLMADDIGFSIIKCILHK